MHNLPESIKQKGSWRLSGASGRMFLRMSGIILVSTTTGQLLKAYVLWHFRRRATDRYVHVIGCSPRL